MLCLAGTIVKKYIPCSKQKAFQVADLLLLKRQAGSGSDPVNLLCLVEKVDREGGRKTQKYTLEVLVSAAIRGSGTPYIPRFD